MARASRFFLFQRQSEFWIVDENSLQAVPKPRELIIKLSTVEAVRDYVIHYNKKDLPIVDKCRDRTGWHTPEGRERIKKAKLGNKHPSRKKGWTEEHKQKISDTMTGTRVGEFNPMYGRKHNDETIKLIRMKAFQRPKRKWCVEPNGSRHLVLLEFKLPDEWQWGREYDPYRPKPQISS
jgi:hypothetical protein|tara:strand:+ start:46 stop:582 length:537 start_codon:yes stop_codon:yes gene_type:complete